MGRMKEIKSPETPFAERKLPSNEVYSQKAIEHGKEYALAGQLIDNIDNESRRMVKLFEKEWKPKHLWQINLAESLSAIFGYGDIHAELLNHNLKEANEIRSGLSLIQFYIKRGRTLEEIEKIGSQEFMEQFKRQPKEEVIKRYSNLRRGIEFLKSNMQNPSNYLEYFGDVYRELNFHAEARRFYETVAEMGKNVEQKLAQTKSETLKDGVFSFVGSLANAKGVVIIATGPIVLKHAGAVTYKGIMKAIQLSPKVRKTITALEASNKLYHSSNLKGLVGITKSGVVKVSGNQFYKGAWFSKGKPIFSMLKLGKRGYAYAIEFKADKVVQAGGKFKRIVELLEGSVRSCHGFSNNIGLAENVTGRILVKSKNLIGPAMKALGPAAKDFVFVVP